MWTKWRIRRVVGANHEKNTKRRPMITSVKQKKNVKRKAMALSTNQDKTMNRRAMAAGIGFRQSKLTFFWMNCFDHCWIDFVFSCDYVVFICASSHYYFIKLWLMLFYRWVVVAFFWVNMPLLFTFHCVLSSCNCFIKLQLLLQVLSFHHIVAGVLLLQILPLCYSFIVGSLLRLCFCFVVISMAFVKL